MRHKSIKNLLTSPAQILPDELGYESCQALSEPLVCLTAWKVTTLLAIILDLMRGKFTSFGGLAEVDAFCARVARQVLVIWIVWKRLLPVFAQISAFSSAFALWWAQL